MTGISRPLPSMARAFMAALFLMFCVSTSAQANTLVRVSTPFGDFTIELFDDATPATVQNFLNYVRRGDYNGTYFHRLAKDFVLQGGAYRFQPFVGLVAVAQDSPVVNEFGVSNLRGTVAMAKYDGNPDSATNQWFVNLGDNAANLDTQNGGFTVFGRVVGDGMTVLDAINQVPVFNLGQLNDQLPLHNFASTASLTAANFLTMNIEIVQRYSSALHVFEYQSGVLSTTVDGGDSQGIYSLNLSLIDDQNGIRFRLNPDSLVLLAIVPDGRATFSSGDNKLRIPQLELNNNGSVRVITNVVLALQDPATWTFVLESYNE